MTAIRDIYQLFMDCDGHIVTDTRKINTPGSLFFALSGDQFNGNLFASQALKKGCKYAVIDDESVQDDDRFILVDDVLSTLQQLANYHRQHFNIPVIAITGSNGKTTTKELLKAILSIDYDALATQGNFNNHIGVPLTLLALRENHTIAIVELGTNNPGEIRALAELAEPTAALISSIGKAHLEGLGTIEGVAKEKLSLFEFVKENQGRLFGNLESNYIIDYLDQNSVTAINYTSEKSNSFSIEIESLFPRVKGQVVADKMSYDLDSSLFGRHNLLNISAALTVSTSFGVHLKKALEAVNELHLQNNRTDTLHIDNCTFYLDAYNANPSSMREALIAFTSEDLNHKWLILGDMFELGEHEIAEHQNIVELVETEDWGKVVLVGKLFNQTTCREPIIQLSSFEDLKEWFDKQDVSSKEILIKGSRGMGLERLIL